MSSHATPDSGYGRNFDGSAGDVLERLKLLLDSTPPHALATRPVRRALLEATVAEEEDTNGAAGGM